MASIKNMKAANQEKISEILFLDQTQSDFSDSSGNVYDESSVSEYGSVVIYNSSDGLDKDEIGDSQEIISGTKECSVSHGENKQVMHNVDFSHSVRHASDDFICRPSFRPTSVLQDIDNDEQLTKSNILHANTQLNHSIDSINTTFKPPVSSSPVIQKKNFYAVTTPPSAKRKRKIPMKGKKIFKKFKPSTSTRKGHTKKAKKNQLMHNIRKGLVGKTKEKQ